MSRRLNLQADERQSKAVRVDITQSWFRHSGSLKQRIHTSPQPSIERWSLWPAVARRSLIIAIWNLLWAERSSTGGVVTLAFPESPSSCLVVQSDVAVRKLFALRHEEPNPSFLKTLKPFFRSEPMNAIPPRISLLHINAKDGE
jgi:hypothetical protein